MTARTETKWKHFQPRLTRRWLTLKRRSGDGELLTEYLRLCRVPLLFPRWCVQMGASVSHSSPPNWHLTAASHGLLRRLRFRPPLLSFPPAWEAAAGTFSCTLYSPQTSPIPPQFHFPRSEPARGCSSHPREPRALIIAVFSISLSLRNPTPPTLLLSSTRCPPPPL